MSSGNDKLSEKQGIQSKEVQGSNPATAEQAFVGFDWFAGSHHFLQGFNIWHFEAIELFSIIVY